MSAPKTSEVEALLSFLVHAREATEHALRMMLHLGIGACQCARLNNGEHAAQPLCTVCTLASLRRECTQTEAKIVASSGVLMCPTCKRMAEPLLGLSVDGLDLAVRCERCRADAMRIHGKWWFCRWSKETP